MRALDVRKALLAWGATDEDLRTLAPLGEIFSDLRAAGEEACVRHAVKAHGTRWPFGAALRALGWEPEEYASMMLDGAPDPSAPPVPVEPFDWGDCLPLRN